jgi:hypothetical protein
LMVSRLHFQPKTNKLSFTQFFFWCASRYGLGGIERNRGGTADSRVDPPGKERIDAAPTLADGSGKPPEEFQPAPPQLQNGRRRTSLFEPQTPNRCRCRSRRKFIDWLPAAPLWSGLFTETDSPHALPRNPARD